MQDASSLPELWKAEEKMPFTGWDFSYVDGRMLLDPPPWSYTSRAKKLMRRASSLLDIATGGGERLLEMQDSWPAKVVATEGYPPNIALASTRLEPLGARVVEADSDEISPMAFADGEFDLVINRHAALHLDEIGRILADGGTLLTRQVHGMWAHDLLAIFGAYPQWPDASPQKYVPWLRRVGLELLDLREWSGKLVFTDVGAVVYYLKAVPWLVPGFSVDTHLDGLNRLQLQLDAQGQLAFKAMNYLIEARKPVGVRVTQLTDTA